MRYHANQPLIVRSWRRSASSAHPTVPPGPKLNKQCFKNLLDSLVPRDHEDQLSRRTDGFKVRLDLAFSVVVAREVCAGDGDTSNSCCLGKEFRNQKSESGGLACTRSGIAPVGHQLRDIVCIDIALLFLEGHLFSATFGCRICAASIAQCRMCDWYQKQKDP